MDKYLGIDVGGTEIKYGIVLDNGEIENRDKIKTKDDAEVMVDNLVSIIKKYEKDIKGVGISFPGFIDSEKGYLRTAGAIFSMYEYPLLDELKKHTDLKINIENDAKCAAISEKFTGGAKDVSDFICITVGSGIGGAVVIDNKLVKGLDYTAGEFGFMITDINTKRMLSHDSGLYALRHEYAQEFNLDVNDVTGELVLSNEIYKNRFYDHLAIGIFNLIYILNPNKILIGGSISKDETFMNTIKERVDKLEIDKNINYIIEPCVNKNNAGILGAVYEVKNK